jgi:hypothetical protein
VPKVNNSPEHRLNALRSAHKAIRRALYGLNEAGILQPFDGVNKAFLEMDKELYNEEAALVELIYNVKQERLF